MKKIFIFMISFLIAFPTYGATLGTSSSTPDPLSSFSSTTGLFSSTSGAVSVTSAGTEMMRVNGTGVGIGIVPTQAGLQIYHGRSRVEQSDGANQSGVLELSNGTNTSYIFTSGIYDPTSGDLYAYTGSSKNLILQAGGGTTGSVGIGTSTPVNLLDIGSGGGIHITSGIPGSTSMALYNNSGTLTWNGTALATGASVSGTTNYIPYFTGSSSLGNSVIYQSGSNIGIGTTSPAVTLDVAGEGHIVSNTVPVFLVERTTNNTTTTLTTASVLAHTSATMADGFGPIISFLVEDTDAVLNPLGEIGVRRNGADNSGDMVFYTYASGTSNQRMKILSNGSVGIGTTSPRGGSILDVNGTLYVASYASSSATTVCRNSNVLSSCSSARRFKEKIEPLELGLKEVLEMKPVTFDFKNHKDNWEKHDFGFIAEDMEKINPLFATYDAEEKIEGVRYMQLAAVNVKAIQEMHNKEIKDMKEMQDKIEKQQAEIDDLRQKIERLIH